MAGLTVKQQAARELLARKRARKSLLAFTEYTHPSWTTGEHHKRICDALERLERREIRRLIITAPPRHSKSELSSRRFVAWFMARNHRAQVILSTYSGEFANELGHNVRDIVRSEEMQRLFPGINTAPDTKAKGVWDTTFGGKFRAVGIGGPATGRGADALLIDDPIKNREEADSARNREKQWQWYQDVAKTRLQPGGVQLLTLTRWHEDDLAGRLIAQGGWEVLELPAIAHEKTDHEQALWPERFPLEVLRDIRDTSPTRTWTALYQQSPRAEQGSYIRREWFDDRWEQKPERLAVYIAGDFAVTEAAEGRDPDSTEFGVFGVDPTDTVHVLDWWHGQVTSDVWCEALASLILKWRPRAFFGEAGVIRRAVEPQLGRVLRARKAHCRLEWLAPIHAKDVRGRAFQGRASMGMVRFPATDWADRVIDQCVGFPGAAHDDAFDVLSLFHVALDQAHPATAAPIRPARRVDKYEQPTRESWRTV